MGKRELNRYDEIITSIFLEKYRQGIREIAFKRDELIEKTNQLGLKLPYNLGDIIYSFRYRQNLPSAITEKAPEGYEWIIRSVGKGLYSFVLIPKINIVPNPLLVRTKILDATPGIITRYSLSDEQALLAIIRYNRLIDIFTGVTCYSLQNHLRTTVAGIGQVETDEVYFGVDKNGVHYVFPVQAKGGKDKIGPVQIEQDFAMCNEKFPQVVIRPLAAQFLDDQTIVLFEFVDTDDGIRISSEKHYCLVHSENLSEEEILHYRQQTTG